MRASVTRSRLEENQIMERLSQLSASVHKRRTVPRLTSTSPLKSSARKRVRFSRSRPSIGKISAAAPGSIFAIHFFSETERMTTFEGKPLPPGSHHISTKQLQQPEGFSENNKQLDPSGVRCCHPRRHIGLQLPHGGCVGKEES